MNGLSAEERQSLRTVQDSFGPEILSMVDEAALSLAGTPPECLDRELQNIGHVLYVAFQAKAPHLSEAMQLGLPFAFVEMVRERLAALRYSGATQ